MNFSTMNSCLTFEQLSSYSLNKGELSERAQLYKHISTCELCTCAVNGFTAISFTSDEVDAIHHQIDLKSNATHASPLTFAQVLFAGVLAGCIFGFYQFADSFDVKKHSLLKEETTQRIPRSVIESLPTLSIVPVVVEEPAEAPKADRVEVKEANSFTHNDEELVSVEPLASITPNLEVSASKTPEVVAEQIFNSNVIYIYDLKVTEYNSLYFNYSIKPFELKGHTPAYKETKKSVSDLNTNDFVNVTAADKVLKSGLASFGRENYDEALAAFNTLLEYNKKDVNALFYSGISYYYIGDYSRAAKNLKKVLSSENNTFHPEAKWNLALICLKASDKTKAKQLLNEIVSEKGFYAAKANEKLKAL